MSLSPLGWGGPDQMMQVCLRVASGKEIGGLGRLKKEKSFSGK